MTDTLLLEKIIKDSGLKKGYIADQLGITRYGLAKKISNESEFKTSEVEKLSRILGINNLKDRQKIFF
jgi:hypothetical protein